MECLAFDLGFFWGSDSGPVVLVVVVVVVLDGEGSGVEVGW